ncbi:SEC-C domain-containing protein [Mumia sp. ZJ1417]|uniref:YchJ family protein n=1 Tax=Mumia sp. ZJ1417 TaxID=2708082 RepID=UPI001423AC0E|nr:YchJ family metal-binding protein [Mumia sp. ZJ1417]QMW67606.1 SEC-C domain-containing protein [Mumia sp. ZJ1417]
MSLFVSACPCGSAEPYDACCGPLHRGERQAATPEELMRARYAAYAVDARDYVFRTWHPRTRPDDVPSTPGLTWERLEILDAADDEVEFVAHYRTADGPGTLHERSRFEQRAGRWFYVDG